MELSAFNYLKNLSEMEDKKKLINNARKLAINSIKDFLNKLNIDYTTYEEIFNIDIKIDILEKDNEAVYFPETNIIVFNTNYLQNKLSAVKMVNTDENMTDSQKSNFEYTILLNVEQVLIHEMLHAIRRDTSISNRSNDANDKNNGIEEILSESIADLIVRSNLEPDINIDKLDSSITEAKNYKKSDILGFNLIKLLKIDLLKWFLTSQNYDYLKEKFTDDYDNLIKYAFILYEAEHEERKDREERESIESFNIANDIINKRKK